MGIIARIKRHFGDEAFLLRQGVKTQVQEMKDGFHKEHSLEQAILYHGKQLSWHEAAIIYFFFRFAGWKVPAMIFGGIAIMCFISYLVKSWKMAEVTSGTLQRLPKP